MVSSRVSLAIFGLVALVTVASGCQVEDVKSTSYTTTDGLVVSHVAYIATFSLTCGGNARSEHLALYAETPTGKTVPVVTAADGKSYQISWAEETAKARSGEQLIKVYDEEGYGQLRKNQRKADEGLAGTGDSVTPITTLSLYHPGTYQGPWVNIEVIAALGAILVWWTAFTTKSRLTA